MELLHTAHVPAGNGPFPTILALHGWGASAHDLLGIAPMVQQGEALFLCPQGPLAFEPAPGQRAYGWFPLAGGGEIDLASIVEPDSLNTPARSASGGALFLSLNHRNSAPSR